MASCIKLFLLRTAAFVLLATAMTSGAASANDLRVVTYNVDADTGGADYQKGGQYAGPGIIPVLEAMGAIHLGDGISQPIDVLALEEMNAPSTTAAYFVSQLNSYYQSIGISASYAYDPNVDPSTGGTGGGPSGLIYNVDTVQDLGVAFLPYGGSGAARAPARYTLQPVGASNSSKFYLYVSHMKSGSDSGSVNRRNIEAQEIRTDSATLGTGANVLYAGDFNGSPGEAYYTTLTASGAGQAFDPGYLAGLLTESATTLAYRDDYQFSTGPVYSGTASFRLIPSSYTVFGNNGSVGGNVNQPKNTALNDLGSNASTILADLTTATDHLPAVADYSFTTSGSAGMIGMGNGQNVTIITGGTGAFGATVTNVAPAGYGNLNFSLTATPAKLGTSMTLGAAAPSTGTLTPGASKAFTIPVTSTTPSVNPVFAVLTALDPGSANISLSTTASLIVLRHAFPALLVGSGNNQRVIQGAAGITAGLVLYDAPGPGYASLDVNSLGSGVSGTTGGALVSSGSTLSYSAALNTGTVGLQNQVFSLNVGDDHTLPGASAPTNISTTASLTVLDHAAGSATVTAGDGFLVRAGATGLSATISLSNAAGTRCNLEVAAAPTIGAGVLNSVPSTPYYLAPGAAQTYAATFSARGAAGAFSDTIRFASVGDDQSLPGASAPGSLSVSITGNVYSGNAVWTGSGSSWTADNNWLDVAGGPTAAPGTDAVLGHDTATFADSAAATAIDLTGANPNLQSLSFSSSNYTLSNGSLTLQSDVGGATVIVSGNKQTIDASTVVMLASSADVVVAAGAELDINAAINESGGPQPLWKDGGGTLVLSGTNRFDGGTVVLDGMLVLSNGVSLADGSSLTIGGASFFAPSSGQLAALTASAPSGSRPAVASLPEPRTVVLLVMAGMLLAARAERRRRTE